MIWAKWSFKKGGWLLSDLLLKIISKFQSFFLTTHFRLFFLSSLCTFLVLACCCFFRLISGIERNEIEDPDAYNKDPMWGKEATMKEWTEHFKRAWFKDLYADEGYQRKPKNDRYPWEPEEEPRP